MNLNLGSGERQIDGYIGVDIDRADVRHDLSQFPWPFEDESADSIIASHILEHLTRDDGLRFLAECYRILAQDGVLYLAVPDMDKFITCRLTGDFAPLGGYEWTDLNYLMGGDHSEVNIHHRHRYMWCELSLRMALTEVGFSVVKRVSKRKHDNPRYELISLYVTAWK